MNKLISAKQAWRNLDEGEQNSVSRKHSVDNIWIAGYMAAQKSAIAHGMMMAAATFHRHCTHTDEEQEQTYFGNASELRAYDEIIAAADRLELP